MDHSVTNHDDTDNSYINRLNAYVKDKVYGTDSACFDECWASRSFLNQLMDVWPEAYRLLTCDDDNLDAQWDVLDTFCNKIYADPNVTNAEKEELAEGQYDLYRYFILKDGSITQKAAFSWWRQWKYDVNFAVAYA